MRLGRWMQNLKSSSGSSTEAMEQIFLQESLGMQEKVTWVSSEWGLIQEVMVLATSKSQYTELLRD